MNRLTMSVFLAAFSATVNLPAQVRIGIEDAAKLLISKPDPVYPPLAKAANVQGEVRIEVTVSDVGAVTATRLLHGHPLLVQSAKDAVTQYRYSPYTVDGKAIAFLATVVVPFTSGAHDEEFEKSRAARRNYFDKEDECRVSLSAKQWVDAERACEAGVMLAQQLPANHSFFERNALALWGDALMGQQKYKEASEQYGRALEMAKSTLKETDPEMGYLYRELGFADAKLHNLDAAREMYRKAEAAFESAEEHADNAVLKTRYHDALKGVLERHRSAAEEAADGKEVREIDARLALKP